MIKRLARCIREYKWAAILSPITMVGEVAMEVTIPLIMADLYDYGIVLQDMRMVVTKSILLVLCAIASLCFGCASAVFAIYYLWYLNTTTDFLFSMLFIKENTKANLLFFCLKKQNVTSY